MCLATVYKTTKDTEEVVLKNVSKIYVEGSQVRLVDIMGAETVVEGSIPFVDLTGRQRQHEIGQIKTFDHNTIYQFAERPQSDCCNKCRK